METDFETVSWTAQVRINIVRDRMEQFFNNYQKNIDKITILSVKDMPREPFEGELPFPD
jgi:hypothetical protein